MLTCANNKCERLWRVFFTYLSIISSNTMILSGTSVFLSWLIDGSIHNARLYYHPLNILLPWNQNTLVGYCAEIFSTVIILMGYFLENGILLILFLSMCFHHQTFYEMFNHLIVEMNGSEERRCAKKSIHNLIRFQCSTKK